MVIKITYLLIIFAVSLMAVHAGFMRKMMCLGDSCDKVDSQQNQVSVEGGESRVINEIMGRLDTLIKAIGSNDFIKFKNRQSGELLIGQIDQAASLYNEILKSDVIALPKSSRNLGKHFGSKSIHKLGVYIAFELVNFVQSLKRAVKQISRRNGEDFRRSVKMMINNRPTRGANDWQTMNNSNFWANSIVRSTLENVNDAYTRLKEVLKLRFELMKIYAEKFLVEPLYPPIYVPPGLELESS
ncbi:hypothetical protein MP228_003255 [Amoeboaphelidium protococcarum]|nr:hypothetical protein MP228_003255 [Amoeboaphelidium protococcarum]